MLSLSLGGMSCHASWHSDPRLVLQIPSTQLSAGADGRSGKRDQMSFILCSLSHPGSS